MTPWKTLSLTYVFEALPRVRVSRQVVELPDGQVIDDFYQVHLRSFATVVPILEDGRVVLLRHYKHGPGRVCLGVPAGFVDEGEAPVDGARRELLEETGLVSDAWTELGSYVDNGNQRGCHGTYFLATGCRQVQAPDDGDLEEMEILYRTPEEVDALLRDGAFGVVHQAANWAFARMELARRAGA